MFQPIGNQPNPYPGQYGHPQTQAGFPQRPELRGGGWAQQPRVARDVDQRGDDRHPPSSPGEKTPGTINFNEFEDFGRFV